MNWLAHLVLSDRGGAYRIGNVLPDLVRASDLADLPDEFMAGILRHRQIDAYADAHPVVQRSACRFNPPLRRFGKVLADIIYDHFLARHWESYSQVALQDFLDAFYRSVDQWKHALPSLAYERLDQVRRHGWMGQYGEVEGVRTVFERLGHRLRRPVELGSAAEVLQTHYHEFEKDFLEFFPDIRKEVAPEVLFPLSI